MMFNPKTRRKMARRRVPIKKRTAFTDRHSPKKLWTGRKIIRRRARDRRGSACCTGAPTMPRAGNRAATGAISWCWSVPAEENLGAGSRSRAVYYIPASACSRSACRSGKSSVPSERRT
jgi:hypothetical protein